MTRPLPRTIPLLASLLASSTVVISTACDVEPGQDPERYTCDPLPDEWETAAEHPRAATYERVLDEIASGVVPGAVWLVRDADGPWVGAMGFADLDARVPMEPCHRTRIASVTKSMVAVMMLELVEQGALSLDDGLDPYLGAELISAIPRVDAIRVHHLLSHSSGLENYLDLAWGLSLFNDPTQTWTSEELLERGLSKKPRLEPGERHEYSNTNYVLAGKVAEGASGQPHEVLLEEHVFEALGMQDTRYTPDQFEFPDVVRGYLDLYGDRVLVDATETYAINGVTAAGGVVSTATDLARFLEGSLREDGILAPELRAAALDFLPTPSDHGFTGYGLGFERWETPYGVGIGHTGQEMGYLTFAYWFPESNVTFVLWVNASSISTPTDDNLTGDVVDYVLPALLDAVFAATE